MEAGGSIRDRAVIEVLLETGLRVEELLALRRGNVELHPQSGVLVVRWGKGGMHRRVPLAAKAVGLSAEFSNECAGTGPLGVPAVSRWVARRRYSEGRTMNYQEALDILVDSLATFPTVEGAFLSGSLANQFQDEFSDIDLGVATKNSARSFSETFALRHQLVTAVGEPVHFLERGWGHCKMIAALYSESQFPPIGLEIDIIFSQLRYVSEQMPYSEYKIVFDRNGRLRPMLARIEPLKPGQDIGKEIAQHLRWFPFYVHDARKASRRGDRFQVQSLLEEMRKLIFFAAATCQGGQVFGSKRAYRYLSAVERRILEESYCRSDEDIVAQLARLYLERLTELQLNYQIAAEVESAKTMLRQLL